MFKGGAKAFAASVFARCIFGAVGTGQALADGTTPPPRTGATSLGTLPSSFPQCDGGIKRMARLEMGAASRRLRGAGRWVLRIVVTTVLAVSVMAPVLAVGARTAHASTDYRSQWNLDPNFPPCNRFGDPGISAFDCYPDDHPPNSGVTFVYGQMLYANGGIPATWAGQGAAAYTFIAKGGSDPYSSGFYQLPPVFGGWYGFSYPQNSGVTSLSVSAQDQSWVFQPSLNGGSTPFGGEGHPSDPTQWESPVVGVAMNYGNATEIPQVVIPSPPDVSSSCGADLTAPPGTGQCSATQNSTLSTQSPAYTWTWSDTTTSTGTPVSKAFTTDGSDSSFTGTLLADAGGGWTESEAVSANTAPCYGTGCLSINTTFSPAGDPTNPSSEPAVGQTVTVTSTVTNTATVEIDNLVPAPLSGAIAAGTVNATPASVASLSPGASTTFTWSPQFTSSGQQSLDMHVDASVGSTGRTTFGDDPENLTVASPPTITSADNAAFGVGTAGTFTVNATDTNTTSSDITLSETGALPAGVTFVDNGNDTATLAGTPAAGSGGTYPLTISAKNGSPPDATQTFNLVVNEPPTFLSSYPMTTFNVGTTEGYNFTATDGITTSSDITLSETGALPAGVTFVDNGNDTATLGGVPAAGSAGSYPLTITASNGTKPDTSFVFTLTVDEPPTITSADNTSFGIGTAGTFTVNATDTNTTSSDITLSETGALPAGVTFVDNGNDTATLAGTPAAGSGGTYPLTISAKNGSPPDATQTFNLVVNEPPTFLSSYPMTTFNVGTTEGYNFTATDGITTSSDITLSETGALPAGVTFVDNGNDTATLGGVPAAGSAGSYPLTITASNGTKPDTSFVFTLTVDEPPTITSADNTSFGIGTAGTFTVNATDTNTTSSDITLSETGALPAGVTFVDNGNDTATLAGTPAAGSGGTYPLTISAKNGSPPDATQTFNLVVNEPPTFLSSYPMTTFNVGTTEGYNFTATDGITTSSDITLSETGALPAGVTFVDNGNDTATLGGVPAAGSAGSYPLTITASNGTKPDTSFVFTLTVDEPPTITSADNTSFGIGTAGTFTVNATDTNTTSSDITLSETGALPAGVTFVDNGNDTATLAGTPAAGSGGTYPLTISAKNGSPPDATQTFNLVVNEPPTSSPRTR